MAQTLEAGELPDGQTVEDFVPLQEAAVDSIRLIETASWQQSAYRSAARYVADQPDDPDEPPDGPEEVAEAEEKPQWDEEDARRMLALLDGETSGKIFTIAKNPDLSLNQKLRASSALDETMFGWTGERLAHLFGVTPQAIYKTDWWTVDSKRHLEEERRDRPRPEG
jgi:hypothetical protein